MNRFLDEHKDNWRRLEDLLTMLGGTSLRGLTRMEVREFGELYRRAAADLAIVRAETRDPKLINYLNSLVIRAHGKIYRAKARAHISSSISLRMNCRAHFVQIGDTWHWRLRFLPASRYSVLSRRGAISISRIS
jgi:hypothetical protein